MAVNSVINFKGRIIEGGSIEMTDGSVGTVSALELCRFAAAIVRHIANTWNQPEDKVWDKARELSDTSRDTKKELIQ